MYLQAVVSHLAIAVESLLLSGVVHLSLWPTVQRGLPLARGRRAFFISCMIGQQVVFETRRTPVVTQFTSTVNVNDFGHAGRVLKLNLPFKRHFSLPISAGGGLFLLARHYSCIAS